MEQINVTFEDGATERLPAGITAREALLAHARNGGGILGEFLGDRARRLAQRARELERDRDGEVAERPRRRQFHRKGRRVDAEAAPNAVGDGVVHVSFEIEDHVRVVSRRIGAR